MLPADLKEKDFGKYPPEARELAIAHLELLRQLPMIFAPILLREVIAYDWKFPQERKQLLDQFDFLDVNVESKLRGFAALILVEDLGKTDWVNRPGQFLEQLTAYLWSSHQMDSFREAAAAYAERMRAAHPAAPKTHRLGIAVVGAGVGSADHEIFRKLKPHGVYFSKVRSEGAFPAILDLVSARAATGGSPFAHWYIDGGEASAQPALGVSVISYAALDAARKALLQRMKAAMQSEAPGPEAMRTLLAETRPEDIGLTGATFGGGSTSAVMNRFQVSLLTEGSGTQIFSTTFAQWAAREALRRAQPETLVVRFAPRQRQRAMNEMLFGSVQPGGIDAAGSLIDADMGAYYTWLNLQRLPGAERSGFLAWFEDHGEAVAIGPSLPAKTTSSAPMEMPQLLKLLT